MINKLQNEASYCASCTKLPNGIITKEWLVKAIQTAQMNINILKIELRGPKPYPGAEFQLEYEQHVLELLLAEYEGRMRIQFHTNADEKGVDENDNAEKVLRQAAKKTIPTKKKLFRLGSRFK